jgi:hypothetical protein
LKFRIPQNLNPVKPESVQIQDEPGGGIDFQRKMSLKDSDNSIMIGACD